MRALVPVQTAVAEPSGLSVVDWVFLLVAAALTLLVAVVAMQAAARSRVPTPPEVPETGFTLFKGAGWLQAAAVALLGVAALLLLWSLVLRIVQSG